MLEFSIKIRFSFYDLEVMQLLNVRGLKQKILYLWYIAGLQFECAGILVERSGATKSSKALLGHKRGRVRQDLPATSE